jgi:replicative DNA helicase
MPERPLPCSPEAERLILGSMLAGHIDPEHVLAVVAPDDFSLDAHRKIVAVIRDLANRGEAINRVTVYHELRARNWHESCGGLGYLADLQGDSLAVNLDSYLRRIRDTAILRKTILAAEKLAQECYAAAEPPAELLGRAERLLRELAGQAAPAGKLRTVEQIIEAAGGFDRLVRPDLFDPGIPTPWPALNKLIGGLRRGQLIVVGARPSVGKTAFLSQTAAHAVGRGLHAAFFSFEMSASELLLRTACAVAGIDGHKVRLGRATHSEREALIRAMHSLAAGLRIHDEPPATVSAVRTACRRAKAEGRLDLVCIDYLQLMEAPGRRENRVQEIAEISRGLKLLAAELESPLLVAAQLNRLPETERRKPVLSDLRDSGSIEQDADVVIMLHRSLEPGKGHEAEVYVRKHRNGPVGAVILRFHAPTCRFEEPAPEREYAEAYGD